jgi:hypothetical protein
MALAPNHPLREMSTSILLGGKERPARKPDITAIRESIVYKMWKHRRFNKRVGIHGLLQR